jgi:RecA-family ATPase
MLSPDQIRGAFAKVGFSDASPGGQTTNASERDQETASDGAGRMAAREAIAALPARLARAQDGARLGVFRNFLTELQRHVRFLPDQTADHLLRIARAHRLCVENSDEIKLKEMVRAALQPPPSEDHPADTVAFPGDFPLGDEPPLPDGPEAYGQSPDGEPEPEGQGQGQNKAPPKPPPPLKLVSPTAWRGIAIPPMQWLATNRIPGADATILSGDGGAGKTIVALQLAVAVAQELGDWLGTTCEPGPVIFFSAEEPEAEMRRRLYRVARKRGIEPDDIENLHFHFADPDACLLGVARPNGPIVQTPLFELLRSAALDIRPALIVVDSIAASFGGNQNDRVHARSFVGLFRRLARDANCAVLLLDHPSLSGINSGTGRAGSVDWQNATRARLHLETVDDDEGGTDRVLEVKKTNYGPCGEKVKLRWEDGAFVLQGAVAAPAQAAAFRAADRAYLDCLDVATAQGRNVFAATGRGHAPKVFAGMPEAKGTSARAFRFAQERLFSDGLIWNEPYGPASKESRRIARKPPEPSSEATQ